MTTTGKLLDMAKKMAEAAAAKAIEIDVPMVIVICDASGNTVLFNRMEDSLLASMDIATNKAYTYWLRYPYWPIKNLPSG